MRKSYSQTKSFARLLACGLRPTEAASICKLVQKWVNCSGEEETVSRLKKLKDAYLHHLVGQKVHLDWFKQHANGRPKGPFSVLWSFKRSDLFKCWNAIMLYSGMTYNLDTSRVRMTGRQYAKFIKAVYRKPVDKMMDGTVDVLIENFCSVYDFPAFTAGSGSPVVSLRTSPTRRAPNPQGYQSSTTEEESLVASIGALALRPKFTTKHFSIYAGVLKGFEESWSSFAWTVDNSTDMPLSGRIGVIQEPGYKARVVANPYRVHQAAMLPLKEYVLSALRSIPTDYVYDQDGGVAHVQSMLKQGHTCYSVDLTNASDNLPLVYQERLLRRIGIPENWVSCFRDICAGDWELPTQWLPPKSDVMRYVSPPDVPSGIYPFNGDRYLHWTVGQPLGLGPSFGSAFLLHHAIVTGLHVLLNQPLDYAMVGDDLVIFHQEVYEMYKWVMDSIGVEVSKEKTLISDRAGEFLSRIILPDLVLRGYKWKGSGDNSFWDVARALGPRSLGLFQTRQKRVIRVLGMVPEPYGLGWNPEGRSYWDRLSEWIDAFERLDVSRRDFVSTVSSLNFRLYTGNLKFVTDKGYPVSAMPDQGIEKGLGDFFPPRVLPLGELLLPNLDFLAHLDDDVREWTSRGYPIDKGKVKLFLKDFTVQERLSDITQLIRLERIIHAVTKEPGLSPQSKERLDKLFPKPS